MTRCRKRAIRLCYRERSTTEISKKIVAMKSEKKEGLRRRVVAHSHSTIICTVVHTTHRKKTSHKPSLQV